MIYILVITPEWASSLPRYCREREICFYYGTQMDQQTTFYCLAKAEKKVINNGQKSDPTTTSVHQRMDGCTMTQIWMDEP